MEETISGSRNAAQCSDMGDPQKGKLFRFAGMATMIASKGMTACCTPFERKPHFLLTKSFGFFEWMPDRIVLSYPYFLPFFGDGILHPDFLSICRYKLADESGIPEFAGDAKVFTAAHQSVGFTALR